MRTHTLAKIGVFVPILAIVGALAGVAAASCNNTRSDNNVHYHAGNMYPHTADRSTSNCLFGTDTFIYVAGPAVQSSGTQQNPSFSTSWTGVQFDDSNNNLLGLGQTGWMKNHNGNIFNFDTIYNGSFDYGEIDFGNPSVGNEPDYNVTYTYSTSTFHFTYDNSANCAHTVHDIQYPSPHLGCNDLTQAINSGEVSTLHNQMPGESSNHNIFDDEEVMSNGGTWTFPTGDSNWQVLNENSTYFGSSQHVYTNNEFHFSAEIAEIWDKCNS